jgi:hypothetical protein
MELTNRENLLAQNAELKKLLEQAGLELKAQRVSDAVKIFKRAICLVAPASFRTRITR